jgi:kinetochor protein Mis14/NSL1
MDPTHRKIELQSPSDLTYITSRLRSAARQKLDLHLPPVPSSDTSPNAPPDELRREVEELVEAFVAQVVKGLRWNLSVNGIDVVAPGAREEDGAINGEGGKMEGVVHGNGAENGETEIVEYEAFDEKLRGELSATVARRDALIAKISQQRRTTSKVAAEAWIKGFEEEGSAWEGVGEGWRKGAADAEGNGVADADAIQRQEEVERNWEKAVLGLQRLNKGLPETRARLERAGDVLGYLGGGGHGKK